MRSAAGRVAAKAKAKGRLGGRPENYIRKETKMLKTPVANGNPIKDVAQIWCISKTTIYRYLDKEVD